MNNTLKHIADRYGIPANSTYPIAYDFSRKVELPRLFRRLGFKKGAEIGVRNGLYSEILCTLIPALELICVDPYQSYDDYVELQGEKGQLILNEQFNKARSRLARFNCKFMKMTSMDAVKRVPDNSLDFVFIDGNHSLQYVINDIAEWSKKVRIGGIVSGHDYWSSLSGRGFTKGLSPEQQLKLCQVKDAVDCWTKVNKIQHWFITAKDRCPSWFFVKGEKI